MDDLLPIAVVLAAALAAGRLAVRLGYPAILGEITAGIVIGPAALGLVERSEPLSILGEMGVLLMMLSIGMHLDPTSLRKVSRPGLVAAVGGFVVPVALGGLLMFGVGRDPIEAAFVAIAIGVTSLIVNARILVDLKILDTRIAYVLLSGALISDIAVLIGFTALDTGTLTASGFLVSVSGVAAFALVAWLVGSKVLPPLFARLTRLDRSAVFMAVLATALLFAWVAEVAGIHPVLGTFLAGIFLTERSVGVAEVRSVRSSIDVLSLGILAPIFFVTVGFEVSLDVLAADLGLVAAVLVVATVGMVAGTAAAYIVTGNGWREGLVVGAGMNGRGAVEIIAAQLALEAGMIRRDTFSILVFMAIVTTSSVPVALTRGVAWLRRRGELVRVGNRHGVIIVGAGPVARILGRLLRTTQPVRMIDTNRANQAAGEQEGLEVVPGSGVQAQVLDAAGIGAAATVVAVTPNPGVNLVAAQLAARAGVPSVAVLIPDVEASTFGVLIADGDIARIFPGAVDLLDWDNAVTAGNVSERSLVVDRNTGPLDRSELVQGREAEEDVLPLAVIGAEGRRPWTDEVTLEPGDQIVVLVRARTALAGGQGSD